MNNQTCSNSARGFMTLVAQCRSSKTLLAFRSKIALILTCLFGMALVVGCASTKVSTQPLVTERLPRPAQIWVYDFAATAADVPADSVLAGQYSTDSTYQDPEQIATGRKVGAQIAAKLVEEIRGMGLPAMQAGIGTTPPIQINDIVIRGYLISVNEGSAAKRVAIGFGSGASELKVYAEGFQMTAQGLRKLGSGTSDSEGGKTPGGAVGVATLIATGNPAGLIVGGAVKVYGEKSGKSKIEGRADQTAKEIASVLKKRFEQQGWIK